MKSNSKSIEKKMEERAVADGPNVDSSRWEYRGYGIWETNEASSDSGSGPGSSGSGSGHKKGRLDRRPEQLADAGAFRRAIPENEERSSRGLSSEQTAAAAASTAAAAVVARDSTSPPSAASSATQELDDLMASLSDFRTEEAKSGGPPSTLDAMLGDLSEDMGKLGARATQRGVCGACGQAIAGQVVTAIGRTWHPEVGSLDWVLLPIARWIREKVPIFLSTSCAPTADASWAPSASSSGTGGRTARTTTTNSSPHAAPGEGTVLPRVAAADPTNDDFLFHPPSPPPRLIQDVARPSWTAA